MGTKTRLQTTVSERTIDWQSPITADGSTVTQAVAGQGYFIDTSSNAHTINLPSASGVSQGDIIRICQINGSNTITIGRNGNKINGAASDGELTSDGDSIEYVFVNDAEGFKTIGSTINPTFTTASGGTETTSGNYKIHTFTGDGNFVVSALGNKASVNSGGPNTADYVVVAGGGGGGSDRGGGGGAGGFRESHSTTNSGSYTASPLATPTGITLAVQTYPITVGGGGAAGVHPGPTSPSGVTGSPSVFSTITSAGGGGGKNSNTGVALAGGSGGGSSGSGAGAGGAGNSPPVSPPQGNPGGQAHDSSNPRGAGGGGATAAAAPSVPLPAGVSDGGAGATTNIIGSPEAYAGGGGGAGSPGLASSGGNGGGGDGSAGGTGQSGPANKGGGGGGSNTGGPGGAGGKGVVIIRYQYQGS